MFSPSPDGLRGHHTIFYPKGSNTIDASIYIIQTHTSHFDEGYIEMRTTLNIEDQLIEKASELTGIKEKTTLVKLGLEALIARESAKRLAELGGTEKHLKAIPRRRITEQ
jgi:hypothetical protein